MNLLEHRLQCFLDKANFLTIILLISFDKIFQILYNIFYIAYLRL